MWKFQLNFQLNFSLMRGAFNFSVFTSRHAVQSATESILSLTRDGLARASNIRELDGALTRFYNEAMPIQFLRLVSTDPEVSLSDFFPLFFFFFFD
jgi:hypothetical protein